VLSPAFRASRAASAIAQTTANLVKTHVGQVDVGRQVTGSIRQRSGTAPMFAGRVPGDTIAWARRAAINCWRMKANTSSPKKKRRIDGGPMRIVRVADRFVHYSCERQKASTNRQRPKAQYNPLTHRAKMVVQSLKTKQRLTARQCLFTKVVRVCPWSTKRGLLPNARTPVSINLPPKPELWMRETCPSAAPSEIG
jgi:hypothetical protein